MTTLPSGVSGWSYSNFSHLGNEATAYTASGGVLFQNTMGLYNGGAGSDCYIKTVAPDQTLDWVLEARVRVLDWEITDAAGGNERFAAGFYATPVSQMGVYPSYIDPVSGASRPEGAIDHADNNLYGAATVAQWHTYKVCGSATTGARTLYIDGIVMATDFGPLLPPTVDLLVGDLTGRGNARAEWDYYHFYQVVPAPSGITIVAAAGWFGLARRRRMR
ncbi:MAG: hypothetical protein JNM07_02620 [Phycisphaerae bacterium]|nr:hypothetical protein [Phycisphaerae bacterium]